MSVRVGWADHQAEAQRGSGEGGPKGGEGRRAERRWWPGAREGDIGLARLKAGTEPTQKKS
jgi:hypothetical protein